MSSEPTRADAFELSADPSVYVPRLALESALAELCELIGKTPSCTALTGEAGLGKTLLLHVLQERLGGAFECLYVPSPRMAKAPTELWSWVAGAIGLGSGEDDRGAVLGRAHSLAADGSGLVLLVDDAAALAAATRSELIAACETPGLSLVLAFAAEDLAPLEALPANVRRIDLGPPMTLVEMRAYVQARLRRSEPEGEIGGRLGARRLAELHEASGGVPARLHALLDAQLRRSGAEPSVSQTDEPRPIAEGETAAAQPAAQPVGTRAASNALRYLLAQLQTPRTQLAIAVLLGVLTGGFWLFALQRVGGAASVGVPVERFEMPRPEVAPKPLPAAKPVPSIPAVPVEEPLPAAPERSAKASARPKPVAPVAATVRSPEQVAPRALRSGLQDVTDRAAPVPDASRSETPVQLVSARFPDEHVPATLEATPPVPPPAGPRLSVNAAPWAEIHLDGKPVGETPLGELAVAPGPHVVTATLPDGRVIERSVEARVGDVYLVFP
jgi:type II secretory pathway predicted ATPase ExeA